jgi:DHA2 family multidrug resistance protein
MSPHSASPPVPATLPAAPKPAAAVPAAAPVAPAQTHHPAFGVAAVLLGAVISTLNSRISTIGLADVRGGLGLDFDTGSWLNTAYSSGQIMVVPAVAALSATLGPRRVMLWATTVFAVASFALPLVRDEHVILALQFVRAFAIGAYIPAALPYILRFLPPSWVMWGIAAYSFRFVFTQNIGVSLEAWLADTRGWEWIFWHDVALVPLLIALIWFGMPRTPIDKATLRQMDWWGMVYLGLGLALLNAGLDQGNRLDWFRSGTVVGMLLGGIVMIIAFAINETLVERPLVRLAILRNRSIACALLVLMIYSLGVQGSAYLIPQFLQTVQLLRPLQVGDALIWIALPQIVLVPLTALLIRVVDARLVLACGLAILAIGSWHGTALTDQWNAETFLPAQAWEAVGLAFAITALVFFTVANTTPADALTIGVLIQATRLFGTESTTAFIQTYVRVREQVDSNLLGLNVRQGMEQTDRALAALSGNFAALSNGLGEATARGVGTLSTLLRRQANVLAFIDGFWIVAYVLAGGMLLVAFMRPPPPNPFTPPLKR